MSKIIPTWQWGKTAIKFRKGPAITKEPWFQGVLLLACVVVAMLLANLPFTKDLYHDILHTNIQLHLFTSNGDVNLLFPRDMTVEKFINDILMAVFFFTVGLEIKREIEYGELSSFKKAIMPIIAAFGGVVAPAVIFTVINHGTAAHSGWGIPTATDIAFAVCILTVLGARVPVSLKVFLTALAIADDLIAILVVAIFYGGTINLPLLGIAAVVILFSLLLKKQGVTSILPYLICAVIVWILFYYSGIHATMSGVVMAFLIPAKAKYGREELLSQAKHYSEQIMEFDKTIEEKEFPNGPQKHCLHKLSDLFNSSMDMSYRVEHVLTPWVNYLIMPIFALANAGVEITNLSYFNVFSYDPVIGSPSMGIFLGLLLGKPIGITLLSWIAIKLKVGQMPDKATWPMFFAVACLGGIGFTMSIFVDTLSFGDQSVEIMNSMRDAGKIAVLMGSICAAILGSVLVCFVHKIQKK